MEEKIQSVLISLIKSSIDNGMVCTRFHEFIIAEKHLCS